MPPSEIRYIILCLSILWSAGGDLKGQEMRDQHTFEKGLNAHITERSQDAVFLEQVRQQSRGCEGHSHSELDEKDVMTLARERARMEYLQNNLEWYNRLYFPESASSTVPGLCDNGGFENDFTHYSGFISTFDLGSNTCEPTDNFGNPITFVSTTMPLTDRIEIVTSGTDTLVGIPRTKFGSKALRLNNRYGHSITCSGNFGVDRIEKEFLVTDSTRDITVWYALVLENPAGHNNSQPWFSISCDLAPNSDLCFDAEILDCAESYADSTCTFEGIDVLEWSCHRIRIPESEIGNTATLAITVADCGEGAHFGYAYIDGICEPCDGSATGSIELDLPDYCYGDSAVICGTLEFPSICEVTWTVDSLYVPGYVIHDLVVEESGEFCFLFPRSNFDTTNCIDIAAEVIFTNGSVQSPPIISNEVEVCDTNYRTVLSYVSVGSCDDNGTPNFISDDFYYVDVQIINSVGVSWSITQQLKNLYPNESGFRNLESGSGNATLTLGPFLIQEGQWEITIQVGDCIFKQAIDPGPFCTDCEILSGIEISGIECDDNDWSFNLRIPLTGSYTLTPDGGNSISVSTGNNTIDVGTISFSCIRYTLTHNSQVPSEVCSVIFEICPPKPCDEECELEVYVEEVICEQDGSNVEFSLDLNVSGGSGFLCFEAFGLSSGTIIDDGSLTGTQTVGPYDEDIYLTIFQCPNSDCSTNCSPPSCYKTIFYALPDECPQSLDRGTGKAFIEPDEEVSWNPGGVRIFPNPVAANTFSILSNDDILEYQVYDIKGNLIVESKGQNPSLEIEFNAPKGVYVLKYLCKTEGSGRINILRQ